MENQILFILTIFLYFEFNECIVKYDLGNVSITEKGPMTFTLYLKSLDMFLIPVYNDFCDKSTGASWEHDRKYCDYELFYWVCIDTTQKYGVPMYIKRSSWFLYWHGHYDYIRFDTVATTPHYQPCIMKNLKLDDNTNNYYLTDNKLKELSNVSNNYPYYVYIPILVADQNLGGYSKCLKETALKNELLIKNYSDSRWYGLQVDDDIGFIEVTTWSTCNLNYEGSTCWLHCINNNRQDCVCDRTKKIDFACRFHCKNGWTGFNITLKIRGVPLHITVCNLKDLCETDPCKYGEFCLAKTNNTYYCEIIDYIILSQFSDTPVLGNTFYIGEIMLIKLDESKIKAKEIIPYISIRPRLDDPIFSWGIFTDIQYTTSLQMKIVDTNDIDYEYVFDIIFIFDAWDKTLKKSVKIRINRKPDEYLNILHMSWDSEVDFKVYYDEYLMCNSSAEPKYRTLIVWKSNVINISAPFYPSIHVPEGIPTIVGIVVCKIFLFVAQRTPATAYEVKKIKIDPYVMFKWSLISDYIRRKWDTLKCLVKTFTRYTITIIKLEGYSDVYITTNEVPLKEMRGDTYVLVCIYRTDFGFIISKTKEFVLTTEPANLCLFLFTQTAGSIVQCSHDGYIRDEYVITVKMFRSLKDERPLATDIDYIRIPYDVNFASFFIVCELSARYALDKIYLSSKTRFDLYSTTSHIYAYKETNELCSSLEDAVEIPEIISILKKDEFLLWHFIFYLEPQSIYSFNLLSIIVILLMILFFFYCMFTMYSMADDGEKCVPNCVRRIVRWHKLRYFQDTLILTSRLIVDHKKVPKKKESRSNTLFVNMLSRSKISSSKTHSVVN